MKKLLLSVLALSCLCASGQSLAVGGKTVNLTLHILVDGPSPCSVIGGDIDFGDVATTGIDGGTYVQPINYSLSCGASISNALRLQIQGTAVEINGESVLSTDVPGLGIRLQTRSNQKLLKPGTTDWLNFLYTDGEPALEAVLVKNSSTTLAAGEFSARATLVVDYQ
ncbi:fimbrial protein [Pseudocitrobacter cyperus]|uniref:Fimbrial protein n=1 Tax=Pseudocitrobacter cyperus TaxID=3112843 RepID=A0ABV0HJD9_9ENTR